jgi:two-component system, chemotaxis family, protein-glutamate methylesterase/glutaminase
MREDAIVDVAATSVVVMGGSAGALEAVRTILSTLPAALDAAILVALHTAPEGPGYTAEVLQRATALHVAYPVGTELLLNGCVYVAPPDRHLQVTGRCAQTTSEPLEHHTRPAVDVLFRSAARMFEQRVIAILLSGSGGDGTAGSVAVQAHGGVVIVQAPDDAAFDSMPRRALEVLAANYVLPAALIAAEVQRVLDNARPAA